MAQSIDWLVFDIGGVLVEVEPGETTIKRLAAASATPYERVEVLLRERFDTRPLSPAERFQTGELDAAGFHAALSAELNEPIAYASLIDGVLAMLRGEKTETRAVLQRLGKHYRIACYSNTNAVHWRYMQRYFEFFHAIDPAHRFASQEIGYAKPDRRGFDAVAAALDAAPERCVLIDDRPANVEGARRAGWRAIVFTDGDALARDLADDAADADGPI